MKSILLSIRPEWVAKILNGEKTIEIRRKFPKDYVGWVYIYCTKGDKLLVDFGYREDRPRYCYARNSKGNAIEEFKHIQDCIVISNDAMLNGKVCCRFWCDKVEEFFALRNGHGGSFAGYYDYETGKHIDQELVINSFGNFDDFHNFCRTTNNNLFAIHISKLEVFDRPRELKEFWHKCEQKEKDRKCANCPIGWALWNDGHKDCGNHHIIYDAPQNFIYIESEE